MKKSEYYEKYFKIKNILPLLLFFVLPISAFGVSVSPNTTTITAPEGTPPPYFTPETVNWSCTTPLTDTGYSMIYFFESETTGAGSQNCNLSFDTTLYLSYWLEHDQNVPFPAGTYHLVEVDNGGDPDCSGDYITCRNSTHFIDETTITILDKTGLFFGGTANDLVANVGIVSSSVYNGAFSWLMLSAGVFLAFYILQKLIMLQPKPEKEKKKDRAIRDKTGKQIGIDVSNDGYRRITGKNGVIGWVKE